MCDVCSPRSFSDVRPVVRQVASTPIIAHTAPCLVPAPPGPVSQTPHGHHGVWDGACARRGRQSCSNGHQLEYKGVVMSSAYGGQNKAEWLCVDYERSVHRWSSNSDDNGGLLYTTEMEAGSAATELYPANKEVGCAVCSVF